MKQFKPGDILHHKKYKEDWKIEGVFKNKALKRGSEYIVYIFPAANIPRKCIQHFFEV